VERIIKLGLVDKLDACHGDLDAVVSTVVPSYSTLDCNEAALLDAVDAVGAGLGGIYGLDKVSCCSEYYKSKSAHLLNLMNAGRNLYLLALAVLGFFKVKFAQNVIAVDFFH